MFKKINRMQNRKMMNHTYIFTPASSHQRVHPESKVIVELRLCLSSCPVHHNLSHVWQSILEYCKILFWWIILCTNAVSLFFLLTRCFGHAVLTPQPIKIWVLCAAFFTLFAFFHDIYIYGVYYFSLQSNFYPLPFFACTGGVSKWWNFRFMVSSKLSFLHLLVNNKFLYEAISQYGSKTLNYLSLFRKYLRHK